jgi:hypothetical protein
MLDVGYRPNLQAACYPRTIVDADKRASLNQNITFAPESCRKVS